VQGIPNSTRYSGYNNTAGLRKTRMHARGWQYKRVPAGFIEWHKTKFYVVASPLNVNTIPVILS
jgi:hypothetical protein